MPEQAEERELSMPTTYVMTGATSGMGLQMSRRLGQSPATRLVVGARNPSACAALSRAVPQENLTVLQLDLADQSSVARFCRKVTEIGGGARLIDGIVCNAGLQITRGRSMTADGVETTFAANHLGHHHLVQRLLPALRRGAIVTVTASGTHDPDDPLARRFGFRGGFFPGAMAVARGELGAAGSSVQQGKDRYATSKLCNILWVKEMARRIAEEDVKFLAFDPGLMPGTGLARDRSAAERFGWTYVLPALRLFIAGVSSADRSATAYVSLLRENARNFTSGAYVDFRLREIRPSSDALSPALARDLYDVSSKLVQEADATAVTFSGSRSD
jgi:NAD(P)-dependent dehydrogenase (short-subunit alcohol dehydrogenase family)